MKFYLGTDNPSWLTRTKVPLFVSRRRMTRIAANAQAQGRWALDSGGFTELKDFGRWTISPEQYIDEVRRWHSQVGGLDFVAPMDWMCEPIVIHGGKIGKDIWVGTKLSVPEHQRLTLENLLTLRKLAPEFPWMPVLQGWKYQDYLTHLKMYQSAGVDLTREKLVGVGSVCRRQKTTMASELIRELCEGQDLRVHAFGFKLLGLRSCGRYLTSADSMAWSFDARYSTPLPGCEHRKCTNCLRYALWWREKLLQAVSGSQRVEQGVLFA